MLSLGALLAMLSSGAAFAQGAKNFAAHDDCPGPFKTAAVERLFELVSVSGFFTTSGDSMICEWHLAVRGAPEDEIAFRVGTVVFLGPERVAGAWEETPAGTEITNVRGRAKYYLNGFPAYQTINFVGVPNDKVLLMSGANEISRRLSGIDVARLIEYARIWNNAY